MLRCHDALILAQQNPSAENINALTEIAGNFKYNPEKSQACTDAHLSMFTLGKYLFERGRYQESYTLFILSMSYICVSNWPANLAAIKSASQAAMFIDPHLGMAQVIMMGKFINTLKPGPLLSNSDFLDDLFDTALYYSQLNIPDPDNNFKSTAIMLLKLTIKFGKNTTLGNSQQDRPTSYEKLAQAKQISYSLAMQTLQAKINATPWDKPANLQPANQRFGL